MVFLLGRLSRKARSLRYFYAKKRMAAVKTLFISFIRRFGGGVSDGLCVFRRSVGCGRLKTGNGSFAGCRFAVGLAAVLEEVVQVGVVDGAAVARLDFLFVLVDVGRPEFALGCRAAVGVGGFADGAVGVGAATAVVDAQRGVGDLALFIEVFAAAQNHAAGYFHACARFAFEGVAHVFDPHGQGDGAAIAGASHAARFVETDVDGGDDVGVEADEPGVFVVVGGAGFAGNVGAAEGERAACRAVFDDVLHHFVHDVGVARVDDLRCVFSGDEGLHLRFQMILRVVDFVDDVGGHFVAAVGKYGVAFGHLQRCARSCAQCHGEVGRVVVGFEAEFLDVLLGVVDAGSHQDADGDHVFRAGQRVAQGDGAVVAAV